MTTRRTWSPNRVPPGYLTAAFAQWLVEQGRSVACTDTDTPNPTLLQYAPLKATHLKLSQGNYSGRLPDSTLGR